MTDLHRRLLDATNPLTVAEERTPEELAAVVRAVIELHEPVTYRRRPLANPECESCSADDDLHDVPWPCSTVRTIAQHLGINHGDQP